MPCTCNPLNLAYRFQLDQPFFGQVPCREAADPSIVWYQGRFWLFASKSGGYWHSEDLHEWTFVASRSLPVEDYAPDVAVIDDALVVTASTRDEPAPIFRSCDPLGDDWQQVCDCPAHHDPALFQDDDGRVYRYWGCSPDQPLFACELDRHSLLPIGETVGIPVRDVDRYGWQQRGEGHSEGHRSPHIEGPWMSKHGGRYYLEYAAPGTQYAIYSDAVLVGEAPLGPFAHQAHNPTSYHPSGFMPGAGHGCTFQDRFGNWWHSATMRISARHRFERRVGIWPAGFDADGVFFCNTAFGDWPRPLPQGPWDPWRDALPPWMLLSHGVAARASSVLPGHPAHLAVDEDCQTWWAATQSGPAELELDLGARCRVHAVQLNLAEEAATQHGRGDDLAVAWQLEGAETRDSDWQLLVDRSQQESDRPHEYAELASPAAMRHLRLRLLRVPSGLPAVAGLRVFGHQIDGVVPRTVTGFVVTRDPQDPRNANLQWQHEPTACGYLVRWGVAAGKRYCSQLVHAANQLELRCLDRQQDYWFSVEAWNRCGIGPATAPNGPHR
ncbi:MAG: family 43 glycosylhydrolase [Planctomycetota bacterium]